MNIGLDIGYSRTKVVGDRGRVDFPSVTGTPDTARFSLNGAQDDMILTYPYHVQVGESAIVQSRHSMRREDRDWIEGEEYHALMLTAFSELTTATWADLIVVSGLPIQYFDRDKGVLEARLLGEHTLERKGQRRQTLTVKRAVILPQGLGALCSVCLDTKGNIARRDLAEGRVGLIDVGGKTCNLLSVNRLAEVGRETASVNAGAWDVVRAVQRWLADNCPDLELRDHEIVDAIKSRGTRYKGKPVALGAVIDSAVVPLADQIIAQATQLWNGAGALDVIFIAGGGAHLVGSYVLRHFDHAQVVDGDPVYANAEGYYRFAQRLARAGG